MSSVGLSLSFVDELTHGVPHHEIAAMHSLVLLAQIAIVHATVIDPGPGTVRTDQTVVIQGDRITAVGRVAVPTGARVIDGTGRFVIPGLWDMHVHSVFGDWFPGGRDVILPLFIANGVTGVRDMGGELHTLQGWRDSITAGALVGPRMIISGPMLDGYLADGNSLRFPSSIPVITPDDAVRAVRSLAAQHADFIKVQSEVPHDAYLAAAEEARRQHLSLVGHVPTRVTLDETIRAGQASDEHLMGLFEGCGTHEDQFIAGKGNLQLLLESYDPARCDALIKRVADAHMAQCPTLYWQKGETLLDLIDQDHQPLERYVPMSWRTGAWHDFSESIMGDIKKDPLERRQEYWHRNLTMTGALYHAGVLLLAGTDAAPGVFVVPGFSLHEELAEFVEAGLTPLDALRTATSNAGKFLKRDDIGRVAPGAHADLVVLSANPLDNIRNTTSIVTVVANGRAFDRAGLSLLLSGVERAAHQWRDPSPHKVGFVTVPGGVRIEVLDWGGNGPPLVFLAGLENTAHVFDDFAPKFTKDFHVYGLTRRGWGASSRPAGGQGNYTIPVLVEDVHAALDTLRLAKIDLVGHSIAGQELSWLAAKYPDRIDRLVYLDAGFDYAAHPVPGPLPDQPPPTAADSASPAAGLAYYRKMSDARLPEGDYRATESLSVAGRDLGPKTSGRISAEIIASAQALAPPLDRVHAPTLAIYDRTLSISEFIPWLTESDTAAPRINKLVKDWRSAQETEFAAKVPQAKITWAPGASHYVFVGSPDSVYLAMRTFLK